MKKIDFSSLLNSKNLKMMRMAVIAVIVIGIALFALIGSGKSQDTESGVVAVGFTDFSDTLYSGMDLSTLEEKVSEFTGYQCDAEITSTGINKVYSLVLTFPENAEFDRQALGDFINSNFSDISITTLSVYLKQPAISRTSFIGLLAVAVIISGIMMLVMSIGISDKASVFSSAIAAVASFGFVFALLNILRIGGIERIYGASLAALAVSWYLTYSYISPAAKTKQKKKQNSDDSEFVNKHFGVSVTVACVACAVCVAGVVISILMERPQVALTMAASFVAVAGACMVTPVMYVKNI